MDGWQAVQNWTIFGVVAGGLVYYYYPKDNKQVQKLAQSKEVVEAKKEVKKAIRKPVAAAKKAVPSALSQDAQKSDSSSKESGSKKRKVTTQKSAPTPAPAAPEVEEDEIDMSTRQFAASMTKAREGVDMKKTDNKESRVKTVKAKGMTSPILSSGSSQVEDADDDWSPVGRASGVEDMLEPAAAGPKALRITPSSKPTKEKANKPAKEEVVETKKQRQNRRKKEAEREARQEAERIRKVEAEQQLRTARIARGEPAKNGIPIPAQPAKNHWSEQNGKVQQSGAASSGSNTALLDTFDAESTGSSNAEASTAATSTTDAAADLAESEENDYAKAITESGQDSGWNEVKTKQKGKKRDSSSEANGDITPVAAPVKAAPVVNKIASGSKPKGFQALNDEYEQRANVADPNDASNWDA